MLKTQIIQYHDDGTVLEGYYVYEDSSQEKRPAILVAHDWSGKNNFACHKANLLADLGYVGFAIDMYGAGKTGQTKEEKTELMQPLMQDRTKLKNRIVAAYEAVKQLDPVDPLHIGAIGFCFGGLCVLDLARSGVDLIGAVSFHGLLQAPDIKQHPIKANILVLHGYDDPMVTPDNLIEFSKEMTMRGVDWQLNIYGNTMHAFTNPEANDKSFGTIYNPQADRRSWEAMKAFFKEIFP